MMSNQAGKLATEIQNKAADPMTSVALKASAGAGKTKVLVDRFLRLCIEESRARAHPRSILAITFTKKAAMEIQERLLESTRELALADEPTLLSLLQNLFDRTQIKESELKYAAGLYEIILEDLSGLNVGTIHSFCQLILGRFAAEAGLDPHFTVLDDNADLVDEALDHLEEDISRDKEMSNAARLTANDPAGVRRQLQETYQQAMRLNRWLYSRAPQLPDEKILPVWNRAELLPRLLADLRAFLFPDLPVQKEATVLEFLPLLVDALERFLSTGLDQVQQSMGADLKPAMTTATEKKRAKGLPLLGELKAMDLEFANPDPDDPDNYFRTRRANDLIKKIRSLFLTQKGTTLKFSGVGKGLGEIYNTFVVEEALGVLTLLQMISLLELYHKNAALLKLMLSLMDRVDGLKRRDRVIDFQDLEDMACRLLADEGRALSLLHRLDDSLNHILLDEFQDTNYNQWDMLKPFVTEFLSGNPDDTAKSIFVVGDVKQSIYSFRAAEPKLFSQVEEILGKLSLPTNFRSLPSIVDSVGCVFTNSPFSGLYTSEDSKSAQQACFREDGKGKTVLLEPYAPDEDEERSGDQLAADAAAGLVRNLVDEKTQIRDGKGPLKRDLQWGDICVLCRTRTEIGVYEDAFRNFNIPIIPAGRGMLAASREIQDILALLRWLVYPADDVALATVLRSPIFRCSETFLQDILVRRELHRKNPDGKTIAPSGLFATLRKLKEYPEFAPIFELLNNWRSHLGRESSHDFLRRIFREGRILEKYEVARDDQVRQNLARLFDLALGAEVAGTPTVRHLSDVIERAARRGTEEEAVLPEKSGAGRVNFLTIHGSKGLQYPVVLLVDADRGKSNRRSMLRLSGVEGKEPLLFRITKDDTNGIKPKYVNEVSWAGHELEEVSREAGKADDVESANLLYVAMTRAEEHLYILGADKARGENHVSMMSQIRTAAEAGQCGTVIQADPPGLNRPPEAAERGLSDQSQDGNFTTEETRWVPPVLGTRYTVETPSTINSKGSQAASGSGENRRLAMERGNRVHLLLQLAADSGVLPESSGPDYEEAAGVFANPAFEWVFFPQRTGGRGLSEAAVIHRVMAKSEIRTTGSIDRLVFRGNRIDIIDYKTNRIGDQQGKIEELCIHYAPQLESYRKVMASMYENHEIHTWLLFTDPSLEDKTGGRGQLVEVTSS